MDCMACDGKFESFSSGGNLVLNTKTCDKLLDECYDYGKAFEKSSEVKGAKDAMKKMKKSFDEEKKLVEEL